MTAETNTNRALPLTPDNPETRVFQFPKIKELDALYKLHLQLIEKHAAGQWAQDEPKGEELERLVSVIENWAAARQGRLHGSGKERTDVSLDVEGHVADDLARPWAHVCGTQSPAAKDDALGIAGASCQGGDGVAEGLGFGEPGLECALFGNL